MSHKHAISAASKMAAAASQCGYVGIFDRDGKHVCVALAAAVALLLHQLGHRVVINNFSLQSRPCTKLMRSGKTWRELTCPPMGPPLVSLHACEKSCKQTWAHQDTDTEDDDAFGSWGL